MPRHAKGPRLYLRGARPEKGQLPVWVIRDGSSESSTGCGPEQFEEAQRKLGEHIAAKFQAPQRATDSRRDPDQILVAEVVALYSQEKAAESGLDPATFDGFVAQLLGWWGASKLSEVKRSTCQAYAKHRQAMPDARYKNPETAPRVSSETARRELEFLSSAIGHWHGEDTLTARPTVWLPEKPESPRDAMTRDQAAALLKAAMGYRKTPTGWKRLQGSSVANRKHLRRFVLLGLYTGSRHTVMTRLFWTETTTSPWVDLDAGVVWRRGKGEKVSKTKRRPMVRLMPRLRAHMRRWQQMDEALALELEQPVNSVLHRGGKPIRGKIRTGFEGIVRDAGLPEEITPHWMRHTAATWLMQGGADIWEAAGYLGMTPTTLEKHYGHHAPDHQAGAHKALGRKK